MISHEMKFSPNLIEFILKNITYIRKLHYSDFVMIAMVSQIVGVSVFYSTVCSAAD